MGLVSGRGRGARRLRRPSEALPPLPFMVVEPPENPTFSTKKEIRRGGNLKKGKGFFWWGLRVRAPAGVGAESARLSHHYAGNGF